MQLITIQWPQKFNVLIQNTKQDTEVLMPCFMEESFTETSNLPKFVWKIWSMTGTCNQISQGLGLFQHDSKDLCSP